ncbi:MAG: hypothetical protein PHQ80_04025 [Candidatus ainarchaeum sp.]|nr:hypothetical protein [Candidatus ainarchaeum sp.]
MESNIDMVKQHLAMQELANGRLTFHITTSKEKDTGYETKRGLFAVTKEIRDGLVSAGWEEHNRKEAGVLMVDKCRSPILIITDTPEDYEIIRDMLKVAESGENKGKEIQALQTEQRELRIKVDTLLDILAKRTPQK